MKLIINIDGGSRGNPGPGASGVVVKGVAGEYLLQGGYFLGDCTNNYAEFTALKIALEEAKKLGGTELEIRSDSQLLVRQYLGQYKIKNEVLKEIMAGLKVQSAAFKRIQITHVLRDKNKEADAMVNAALDRKQSVYKTAKLQPAPAPKPAAGEQMELF